MSVNLASVFVRRLQGKGGSFFESPFLDSLQHKSMSQMFCKSIKILNPTRFLSAFFA